MADVPDQLVLKVARDREGKRDVVFLRFAFCRSRRLPFLGLLNQFGQRPSTSMVDSEAARLEVYAPGLGAILEGDP